MTAQPTAPLDLAALARALDVAVVTGGEYLDPQVVADARAAMERGLERIDLGAEHTVVALVGATGSGKSSLFNAVAELEIAETGARRPLTREPMACIWGEAGSAEVLDWLGVPAERRMQRESVLDADRQAPLHGLILLDLPDHDSTEISHRHEVDRLVGMVDLMIWVLDPQKYADDALHTRYLKKLVDHDAVMLVVLNQIDRLSPAEAEVCLRDLRRLLDADGLGSVAILPISARTRYGVEELRDAVARVVRSHTAVIDRSAADLATITHRLRGGVADTEPGDGGPPPGVEDLVGELAAAAGVPAVLDALTAEYRRRGWQYTGWPLLRWVRGLSPDALGRLGTKVAHDDLRVIATALQPVSAPAQRAQVKLAVDSLATGAAAQLPPRWAAGVRAAVRRPEGELVQALDAAVATVDLDLAPPRRWLVLRMLQLLAATLALSGLGWLFAVGAVQLAGRYLPEPLDVLGVPMPVVLAVAGLFVGVLLTGYSGWWVSRSAVQRRERAQTRLREVIGQVTTEHVVAPIEDVLRRHRTVRMALDGELPEGADGALPPVSPAVGITAPVQAVGAAAAGPGDVADPVGTEDAGDVEAGVADGPAGGAAENPTDEAAPALR